MVDCQNDTLDPSLHLLGRPLGLPHHRERDLAVIHAALRLLETAQRAPTIETFTPCKKEVLPHRYRNPARARPS